jgi:hypothetical protein
MSQQIEQLHEGLKREYGLTDAQAFAIASRVEEMLAEAEAQSFKRAVLARKDEEIAEK